MICPKCASENTKVIKTVKDLTNLRWRKCEDCGYSWMTEERPLKDKGLLEYIEYIEKIEKEEGKK